MSEVPAVTGTTFEAEVLNADRPVVVDFWAPWCGPCRAIAPIMQELAAAHCERVSFVKLNVDENPAIAGRFGVLSIPTVILFENGEAQGTVVGVRPRKHFEQAWATWLGLNLNEPEMVEAADVQRLAVAQQADTGASHAPPDHR